MTYRVNILPNPNGDGVIVHAFSYDPKTGTLGPKHFKLPMAHVDADCEITELGWMPYSLLKSIGCPAPHAAEIEDMR